MTIVALGLCAVCFLMLGMILSHYNPSGGDYVMQALLGTLISAGIAILSLQFTIQPRQRPRLTTAWWLLVGALASTGLLAFSPPVPALVLAAIAISLGGGAWIVGATVGD